MKSPHSNAWVFVAFGSNLGQSTGLLRRASAELQQQSSVPLQRSSLWLSAPVDCPPGSPDFVNAVVAIQPFTRTPEEFLLVLQQIERDFGRLPKKILNEARPLDLDIILWGNLVLETESLTIPHPRAASRRFVLEPLAEIAPALIWPGTNRTVEQLRRSQEQNGQEIRRSGELTF